jgi:hypothetical protein
MEFAGAVRPLCPRARPPLRLGDSDGRAYAEAMNRQFRRAQEKQDKKQEKEKTRRREERKARLRQLRSSRARREPKRTSGGAEQQPGQQPAQRGRLPGRFAGVLAAVTVFFIALQGVAPVEADRGLGDSLVAAGFYLMLGYFGTLWFMRRSVVRAPLVTVIGGVLLAAVVTVTGVVQERQPDLLALGLVIPALAIGALLGRLVFRATPR